MRSRDQFKQALAEMFAKDNIHLESDIVANMAMGVNLSPSFDFSIFDGEQLESDFHLIKAYYETLKKQNPGELAVFRAKSAPFFERDALLSVKQATSAALNTLMVLNPVTLPFSLADVGCTLFSIRGLLDSLDEFPDAYRYINALIDKVKAHLVFIDMPSKKRNEQLINELNILLTSLQNFSRHNHYASKNAKILFFREMEAFLLAYRISSTQCSIIEDALLSLADIQSGVDFTIKKFPRCSVTAPTAQLTSSSRIRIELLGDLFGSLNNYDKKLAHYFFSVGDDTAFTSRDSVNFIEVDSKFFYNTILPALKTKIKTWAATNRDFLTSYQEQSKGYIDNLAATSPSSLPTPLTLFAPVPAIQPWKQGEAFNDLEKVYAEKMGLEPASVVSEEAADAMELDKPSAGVGLQ